MHVDQPTSTAVIGPHVPLQPPPSYPNKFSIQASLSASGRYAALASVELQSRLGTQHASTYDCEVVVTAGGVNTPLFDDPITTTGGEVPVDYSSTFVTLRPATLTFQCRPIKKVYGRPRWVNPTLYAGLLVTPQPGP